MRRSSGPARSGRWTMRSPAVISSALLLVTAPQAAAQRVETGFLDRTVAVGGQRYRYQVYVPAACPARASWPVIPFPPASGERGADSLMQTTVGLAPAIRRDAKRFPAIVV